MTKKDIQAQIREINADLQKRLQNVSSSEVKFCATVAAEVERKSKTLMRDTTVDYDKAYKKGKNKDIVHYASAEGEPPAVDTGTLRMSITHEVREEGNGKAVGIVGSILNNPPYGRYLEYGTSKMKPRPWLSRALNESIEFIKQAQRKILGKAIEGK